MTHLIAFFERAYHRRHWTTQLVVTIGFALSVMLAVAGNDGAAQAVGLAVNLYWLWGP